MAIAIKTWTGAESERFTHDDMNRICANANTLAGKLGLKSIPYTTATRATQLDLSDVRRLENQVRDLADNVGVPSSSVMWTVGQSFSHVDINRWEQTLKAVEDASATVSGYTLRFDAPGDIPSCNWTLTSDGQVIGSGTEFRETEPFRVPAGAYTITMEIYGDMIEATVNVTANTVMDVSTLLCNISVSCNGPIEHLTYGDADASPVMPTSDMTLYVVRTTGSRTLTMASNGGSPYYSGLSSEPYWVRRASATVTPSGAIASVVLASERIGEAVILPMEGTLRLPSTAKFEIWAIGGGEAGQPAIDGDDSRESGPGGHGGGVKTITSPLSGEISIQIGAGGTSFQADDGIGRTAPGSTVVTNSEGTAILTAEGGKGAGGGRGFYRNKSTSEQYGWGDVGSGSQYTGAGGSGSDSPTVKGRDGLDGTIIDGMGYGGKGKLMNWGGNGGNGGHGANGGDAASRCGGGGGGIFGGTGGNGECGGLGYGAGGAGGTVSTFGSGGGGGGLGSKSIAGDADAFKVIISSTRYNAGGSGAPGAVRIKWVSDA